MKPETIDPEEHVQEQAKKRRVMVGAIGKCVHNLGVENFADWMEDQGMGYVTVKIRPGSANPGSSE